MDNLKLSGKQIINIGILCFAISSPWTLFGTEISIGILIIGWFVKFISDQKFSWQLGVIDIPIFIYLTIRFVSSLVSIQPANSIRSFVDTEWPMIMFFALTNNVERIDILKRSVSILIWISTLVSVYAIFQHFFGYDYIRGRMLNPIGNYYRAWGNFGFYLTFGGYQTAVFLLGLSTYTELGIGIKRWIRIVQLVLILASVLATYARSAWLGLLVGTLIFLFLLPFKKKQMIWAALGLSFVILVAIAIPEIRERAATIFNPQANIERIKIYESCLNIIKSNPLLGVGEGNFKHYFAIYKVPFRYEVFSPHNDYLNVTVNSGILGLASFLGVWGYLFYIGFQSYRKSMDHPSVRYLLLGSMLGVLSFLIGGFFQGYYTDLEDSFLWWYLAAISTIAIQRIKMNQYA